MPDRAYSRTVTDAHAIRHTPGMAAFQTRTASVLVTTHITRPRNLPEGYTMNKLIPRVVLATLLTLALTAPMAAAEPDDHFIIRDCEQSREQLARSIREFVEADEDWIFLAEFGLAGGAITAVKVCYLPLGPDIVDAGLHVGAMLPCGHIGLYEEDGGTRLSMLHPKFMTTLQPHPSLERAVENAVPAFETLLDAVLAPPAGG